MKTDSFKLFVQLQGMLLLLALSLIPFSDMMDSMAASRGMREMIMQQQYALLCCFYVGIIATLVNLYKVWAVSKKENREIPVKYLIVAGLGVLLLFVGGGALWAQIISEVLLLLAFVSTEKTLCIEWKNPSAKGAFLLLTGMLMHTFTMIDDSIVIKIAAFVGFIIYWLGIEKLKSGLDTTGQKGASYLKKSIVLNVIGLILDMIPLMGVVANIFYIISFIVNFMGYGKLSHSEMIDPKGQVGASRLKTAMILSVIVSLFGFAEDWLFLLGPVGILLGMMQLCVILLIYFGWRRIILGIKDTEIPQEERATAYVPE